MAQIEIRGQITSFENTSVTFFINVIVAHTSFLSNSKPYALLSITLSSAPTSLQPLTGCIYVDIYIYICIYIYNHTLLFRARTLQHPTECIYVFICIHTLIILFLKVVCKELFVDLEVFLKLQISSFGHIGQFLYMDSADGMSASAKLHICPLATSVSSYPWTRIVACRQRRG